ncbi:MAG: IPT/TIG domain-containing protein [Candidatus Dormibacteria bacterium]
MLTIFLAFSGIRVRAGTSTATVTVVVAAPYVTGILPYNLPQATPTNITITGNGFENSSGITVLSVTFTGTHQYTVTSGCKALSPTEITCTTPPLDSGTYTIIVNFSNGQSSTPAFAGSNTIVVYLLATPTPSLTPTATASATPTATVTPSPALSPTVSPSPSTSPSPSFTASPSPSSSPSKPNPPTSSGGFFGSITHAVSSAGHAIGSGVKSITTFVARHVVVVSSSMIIIIIVLIIVLLLSKRKKKEDDEPKSRIRL